MKRIFPFLILFTLFFVPNVFADRDTATVTTLNTSQLIKRGDVKIYSITFKATANGGNFYILDDYENSPSVGFAEVKAEGSEVTALGSQFQDYSNKPLELSNGCYLVITSGFVILRYE